MTNSNQSLGRWGEEQAARYLAEQGYEVLERNFHTEYGELDLIARLDGRLVFVEVKARSSAHYGFPEEAVNPAKQQHILEAAQTYLQEHPEFEGDWRVDVIALLRRAGGAPEIRHFENAFS